MESSCSGRGSSLTVGQKEKITYRDRLLRTSRSSEPFTAPTQGIGYGLGDGLGIVLHRLLAASKRPPAERLPSVHRVIGTVVEETAESVTLTLANGHRLMIRVADIIRRKAVHE